MCDLIAHILCVKKHKFSSHNHTWKLREASKFLLGFKAKAMTAVPAVPGVAPDSANHNESALSQLKVCSLSKNHKWIPETCWWNEQVDDAIQEKHAPFKFYNALQKARKMDATKVTKTSYNDAMYMVKHAVWLAKSKVEKEEFAIQTDGPHKRGRRWWEFYTQWR